MCHLHQGVVWGDWNIKAIDILGLLVGAGNPYLTLICTERKGAVSSMEFKREAAKDSIIYGLWQPSGKKGRLSHLMPVDLSEIKRPVYQL